MTNDLPTHHQSLGAHLAPDGIPLHYGDQKREYEAGLHAAIVLDRSHEGRLRLAGVDRHALIHRMSTNDTLAMPAGAGRATLFTKANAKILERVVLYERGDDLLIITEPGRGERVQNYLQRNIFFNDDAQLTLLNASTRQFALHGPQTEAILQQWLEVADDAPLFYGQRASIGGHEVFCARRRTLSGAHWALIVPAEAAVEVHAALLEAGREQGLIPAGSLTYNVLRIRAGRPAGRELSADYIPLEVGLWDEISFNKGCYTGQEIIARLESRQRLAKTLVHLDLSAPMDAPAPLTQAGKTAGTLTSSVTAPDGTRYALGVVKTSFVAPQARFQVGDDATQVSATLSALAGTPPPYLNAQVKET